LAWWNLNDEQVNSTCVTNTSYSMCRISVQPVIPQITPYHCEAAFATAPSGATAMNIPVYSSKCSTRSMKVAYPPFQDNITVYIEDGDNLYEVTQNDSLLLYNTISCYALTVPPSRNYVWTDPNGNTFPDYNIQLNITGSNLSYTCTASNRLGGSSYTLYITVAVSVDSMGSMWYIGLVIFWSVFLLVVIVAIFIGIYCCMRNN